MTGKERILCALQGGQPDRVPLFEAYINEPVVVRLADLLLPPHASIRSLQDRSGEERLEITDLYCRLVETLDLDSTCTTYSTGLTHLDARHARDKFGTMWALSEHGEPLPVEGPIKGRTDLVGFEMASKLERTDFSAVQHVIDRLGADRAHFVSIPDPFKVTWSLRGGMEQLMVDYALDPDLVLDLTRIATTYVKAAIDVAADLGVDVILLSGDFAGEDTLLMSPQHFRTYIRPFHREIVQHTHARGLRIVKHSDGNMWPILDDILDVGFDGFHPVQPQCMDIAAVKRHLRGRACIIGNIDCRHLLPFGTEAEVTSAVRGTIDQAAPGGGYILSSSNTIHPGCKAENYLAMVAAAREYGRYPLG
jgi:uroporphyrinogen decarboxylase